MVTLAPPKALSLINPATSSMLLDSRMVYLNGRPQCLNASLWIVGETLNEIPLPKMWKFFGDSLFEAMLILRNFYRF
jgi:hypothetical protein